MNWIGDHAWESWLILAGILAVLEIVSMDLILIMLAGGAVAGAVSAALGAGGAVSTVVAAVFALGFLFFLRPNIVHRLHAGPDLRTGTAALIGRQAVVTEAVADGASGRVRIGGESWSALPYDSSESFAPGTQVDVVEIRGATAYVMGRPTLGLGPTSPLEKE